MCAVKLVISALNEVVDGLLEVVVELELDPQQEMPSAD